MTTTGNAPAPGANPQVDHPKHYNSHPSGIECIEVVRHMGFNLGNAVKYLWRDGEKDTEVPLQDLEKAVWYINDEIAKRRDMEAAESIREFAAGPVGSSPGQVGSAPSNPDSSHS